MFDEEDESTAAVLGCIDGIKQERDHGIMGSWDEGSGIMPAFMNWIGYISPGTAASVKIWVRYCCSCWITALQRSNEIRFY